MNSRTVGEIRGPSGGESAPDSRFGDKAPTQRVGGARTDGGQKFRSGTAEKTVGQRKQPRLRGCFVKKAVGQKSQSGVSAEKHG